MPGSAGSGRRTARWARSRWRRMPRSTPWKAGSCPIATYHRWNEEADRHNVRADSRPNEPQPTDKGEESVEESVGESRLVVDRDLHYRLAGRSLHEHEYLRSGPRWPGSSPRATFNPGPVLAYIRPGFPRFVGPAGFEPATF